jgi:hypothetical protein
MINNINKDVTIADFTIRLRRLRMALRIRSTGMHFHPGSEPNFAITSREHPEGAWVVAGEQTNQQDYYDTARNAAACGLQINVVCDYYEDSGDARRFYWGTTSVTPNGFCNFTELRENLLLNLPPLDQVIKNPAHEYKKGPASAEIS